jgi:hypothetical protein
MKRSLWVIVWYRMVERDRQAESVALRKPTPFERFFIRMACCPSKEGMDTLKEVVL